MLPAAGGLGRLRHDHFCLRLGDKARSDEQLDRVGDGGDILAVIFPGATRSRAAAGSELVNAATVGVNDSSGWCFRAGVQGVSDAVAVRVGFAGKGE